MQLAEILKFKFPDEDFVKNTIIQDDSDGKGPYIVKWGVVGVAQPTQQELEAWATDPVVLAAFKADRDADKNARIQAKLDQIDMRSIRALRTNDNARLADLEAQAAVLRAKLVKS